jgi:hypothetical protein
MSREIEEFLISGCRLLPSTPTNFSRQVDKHAYYRLFKHNPELFKRQFFQIPHILKTIFISLEKFLPKWNLFNRTLKNFTFSNLFHGFSILKEKFLNAL